MGYLSRRALDSLLVALEGLLVMLDSTAIFRLD
jgi:hypothetical protein